MSQVTGTAGSSVEGKITLPFSYTILPAMVTNADVNTLAVRSPLDFSLDNAGTVTTLLDGNASGASFDVDSLVGVVVGSTINWSVEKSSLLGVENSDHVQVTAFTNGVPQAAPNIDNLVVGMEVTGAGLNSTRPITIVYIESGGAIVLSERVELRAGSTLSFKAAGITVSSITDGNTVVASQTMAGVVDDFSITFGGTVSDAAANLLDTTVTKVGDDIIIAGSFQVSSFALADTVVKLDLNKLITIS